MLIAVSMRGGNANGKPTPFGSRSRLGFSRVRCACALIVLPITFYYIKKMFFCPF